MRATPIVLLGFFGSSALAAAACGSNVAATAKSGGTGGHQATSTTSSASTATGAGGSGGSAPIADAGAPDADHGAPSNVYPAKLPKGPKVQYYGGPVLASPTIQPIFFSNDDATTIASVEDFYAKVGATAYWAATTSEYGVGPATAAKSIKLTETATGTLTAGDIKTWLENKLNGTDKDPAFKDVVPDANTVFVINYPAAITFGLQGQGGVTDYSCQTIGGYHTSLTLDAAHNNQDVAYAVLPRCKHFGGLDGLDALTGTASHELVEAVSDPLPQTMMPAYGSVDTAHYYWSFAIGGGETGDMCAQNPDAFTKFPELDYVVQRTWSNKAAQHAHDPCVPAPAGLAYFNTVPVLNDTIKLGGGGQTIAMKGVHIPVGQTATIPLDLFSDAPTSGPFYLAVDDGSSFTGGPKTLDLTLDRDHGVNGERVYLTITVLQASAYNAEVFYITSSLGKTSHMWLGLVGN